jgi:hypothetical protein
LTDDDPQNFAWLAAVPAFYAGNLDYIQCVIASERTWRDVPIRYVPDWPLVGALLNLDEIEGLAKQIAVWPFVFEEYGIVHEIEVPLVLVSLASAFRRRIAKYLKREDVSTAVATAADLARLLDESDEQAIAMSFWFGVKSDDLEFGEFVEEAVMATG